MKGWIVLGLYVCGFVMSYIMDRKLKRKKWGAMYEWSDVVAGVCFSTLSWLAVIILVVDFIHSSKPPKWL